MPQTSRHHSGIIKEPCFSGEISGKDYIQTFFSLLHGGLLLGVGSIASILLATQSAWWMQTRGLCARDLCSAILYLLGPVLIFVGYVLKVSLYCIYVRYAVLAPRSWVANWVCLAHIGIATLLLCVTEFSFLMVVFTSPGSPSELAVDDQRLVNSGYCFKCKKAKPARAHHCRVCQRCTLRMDHHCPWLHTCVGHFNHRSFILFIFYGSLTCLYMSITSLPYISVGAQESYPAYLLLVFEFVTALCLGIFLFSFFIWHIYLVFTAQTTVEYYIQRCASHEGSVNIYDLGWKHNFSNFFGHRGIWSFIPTLDPPHGDGITYPTRKRSIAV